jgi:2-alkyl-3-oxoalkanoate reductase
MRIFVTGATGVVGRRLVPLLRSANHDVTALARSTATRAHLQQQGASAIDVDLFDGAALRRVLPGHDVVINLATHIPDPSQMFLPWAWRENDRLRREASSTLVTAAVAAGVRRFVQESFALVYPNRDDEWIDETTPLAPLRFNRTISDAEASAARFTAAGGIGVVLRFAGFYGTDALQTKEMIKYLAKGWGALPGPPHAYISSLSHDDAATAAAAALTVPAGVYNVADDAPVTHRVFVDTLAAALHVPPPRLPPTWITPLFGALGALAARSVRISNAKFRTAAEWAPKYRSVREGWTALAPYFTATAGTMPQELRGRQRA